MPKSVKKPAVYRVYVRHNWGTEKLTVNQNKRSVALARETARLRAVRQGLTGVSVIDVVPCKWVDGKIVETRRRKVTVTDAKAKPVRRAKARASIRSTRRTANAWVA